MTNHSNTHPGSARQQELRPSLRRVSTFDWSEHHCRIDIDQFLAALPGPVRDRALAEYGPAGEWECGDAFADVAEFVQSWNDPDASAVLQPRRTHGSCDCAHTAYQEWETHVQGLFDELNYGRDVRWGYTHNNWCNILGELSWETFKNAHWAQLGKMQGRVTVTIDVFAGEVTVALDSSGIDVTAYAVPGLAQIEFLREWENTLSGDYPAADIALVPERAYPFYLMLKERGAIRLDDADRARFSHTNHDALRPHIADTTWLSLGEIRELTGWVDDLDDDTLHVVTAMLHGFTGTHADLQGAALGLAAIGA